jgi:hypothetical protein
MQLLRNTLNAKKKPTSSQVFLAGAYVSISDEGRITVAAILPCSPAALSGEIAVGDFLLGVCGKRLEGMDTLTSWIQQSHDEIIWLELKRGVTGATHHVVLFREFHDIEVKNGNLQNQAEEFGIGVAIEIVKDRCTVSKLVTGGSAWLAAQSPPRTSSKHILMPGDDIVAIQGKPITGSQLTDLSKVIKGPKWSRLSVDVLRDGKASECNLIRSPTLSNSDLPAAIKYRAATAALPPLPPLYRTGRCGHDRGTPAPNLGQMDLEELSARLVNGDTQGHTLVIQEVAALLTTEEKWAGAALFCSMLAESLHARWKDDRKEGCEEWVGQAEVGHAVRLICTLCNDLNCHYMYII